MCIVSGKPGANVPPGPAQPPHMQGPVGMPLMGPPGGMGPPMMPSESI